MSVIEDVSDDGCGCLVCVTGLIIIAILIYGDKVDAFFYKSHSTSVEDISK